MQWWHPEALWFANISNMILWFTYVKGAVRALTGKFGAGITFKTTIKGAGKLLDSVLGDLWMPLLCFILSAVSLGVGIHKLVSIAMAALFRSQRERLYCAFILSAVSWSVSPSDAASKVAKPCCAARCTGVHHALCRLDCTRSACVLLHCCIAASAVCFVCVLLYLLCCCVVLTWCPNLK